MFKRNFLEILRWGLRLHGIGHLVEVVSAVSEGAYITATLALIFISIELFVTLLVFVLLRKSISKPSSLIKLYSQRIYNFIQS